MFRLLKRRNKDASVAEVIDNESVETLDCRFDGTTKGYFEVWIINLLMMVCTLGLFRPWAKARRRQYFYSNTWLGKHNVNYYAEPRKALAQTAVINFALVGFVAALVLAPMIAAAMIVISLLLYPLARHHELRSSAAATSFRARRMAYTGRLKDSYLRLIGWPIATVAFALLPLGHSMRSSWSYRFENYNYGDQPFTANFELRKLWGLIFKTALSGVFSASMVLAIAGAALFAMGGHTAIEYYIYAGLEGQFEPVHALVAFMLFVSLVFPLAVWRATSERLLLAGVKLEAGVSLDSELTQAKITNLYFFNALAIIVTFGFAIPWAAVRVAKYRASVTTMVCYADIDQLAGDQAAGLASLQKASVVVGDFDRTEELSAALDEGEIDLPKAA